MGKSHKLICPHKRSATTTMRNLRDICSDYWVSEITGFWVGNSGNKVNLADSMKTHSSLSTY